MQVLTSKDFIKAFTTDGRVHFQSIEGSKEYLNYKSVAKKIGVNCEDVNFTLKDEDGDLMLDKRFTAAQASEFIAVLDLDLARFAKEGNEEWKASEEFAKEFNASIIEITEEFAKEFNASIIEITEE